MDEEDGFSAETASFIEENAQADVRRLALRTPPKGVNLRIALRQIEGRQLAKKKLPTWAENASVLFPLRLPLEQCSSETTAREKQQIVRRILPDTRTRMVDLTGGLGVDFSFLSILFEQADYVERQAALCTLARHNFEALHLQNIRVHHEEATEFLQNLPKVDFIFIDPARRDAQGRKTVLIGDCEPDICTMESTLLAKSKCVMAKLSPMLDIRQSLSALHSVREVHIISVDNECKELLLVLGAENAGEPQIFCTHLSEKNTDSSFIFSFSEEEKAQPEYTSEIGAFLYEPDASILKAGAFKCVATRFGVKKLHPNSHLYTADRWVDDFPGRRFCVEAAGGFGKKELKALLGEAHQANLAVRNFPSSVIELKKRLKITDGGDVFLFATTLADGKKTWIRCHK